MMRHFFYDKKRRKWIIFLSVICCLCLSTYLYVDAMPSYGVKSKTLNAILHALLSSNVPKISVQEAYAQKENVLFLDAREIEEYEVSHLPNARYIGDKDFRLQQVSNIPKNTKLIIYCSIGKRSDAIAKTLIKDGYYTNVYNLYGGIFEWVNQGKPVYKKLLPTDEVHAYNHFWGQWLTKGVKVY